ncbi:MAG: beta-lactamase family protein [Pseudomonadota bacterium]|nr:beta-lactamase family protein [Pseudomonadota bacterium]
MKSGIIEIEGVEYPDADASDPIALGWMQGSPPPRAKQIRFQDDRFLEFPQIRWTLSHMREMAPTANVWRGRAAPSDLGAAPHGLEAAIDAMAFEDLHGRRLTWEQSLRETYADGIIVLHRGRRIYERYFGALEQQRPHACFSITKSYAATLAATLIHEGGLDEMKTVSHYLPEMAGTAYEDATLRQVLDMQIGVQYSELYSDPKAHIWDYGRAGGLRPRAPGYSGPDNFYEYLPTLRKEGTHGAAFAYKTVNTEVLCWVMKRVTGIALPDMLSQRIWSQIGCEENGYLTVDTIGVAMGGAGLSAILRDLCRFGELMRCEGAWGGKQVIPAEVIADIRRGSDPAKFAPAGYTLLPGYSYRNMWWVSHNPLGVFEGRGIHGQRLYIAPKAELVIARFASHPVASSAANDPITIPALAAMSHLLMTG